jgi:hypothetical protein
MGTAHAKHGLYLRHHAYELTGVARECSDTCVANKLERFALKLLETASRVENDIPPTEP